MKSLYPIFLFCIFAFCSSAQPNVDSLLKASSYTLQISPQGGLSGDGASFILARAQNAQFVMIGENHNTRELSLIHI